MNVEGIEVKKEDTTEEDPLSDTIQNTTSTTELMDQDPLEVKGDPVKKEDTTEEDPVKQKKIEVDEQMNAEEEPEEDHCSDFVTI